MDIDFIKTVEDTIARHALLSEGDKVIVAVSGGADSLCLLSSLKELGYECIAVHCNYHLRGEESNRDMIHVKRICNKLDVTLITKDFNVAERMKISGESVEMACRSLRYEWFDQLRKENSAKAIATGHHKEDNIETLFLNLLRGTGINGLCGIKYKRDYIIRPLLDVSREQIEKYLKDRDIDFIVDSSNLSDDFSRNKVRNHIIPTINKYFPNAEHSILATIENLSSTAALLDHVIYNYNQQSTDAHGRIDLQRLIKLSDDTASTALFYMIRKYGFTATQCNDIISSASKSGLKFQSKQGYIAELDRSLLTIRETDESIKIDEEICINLSQNILYPFGISVTRHDISEFHPTNDKRTIYLDISALDYDNKWTLRHHKTGDRIKAYGLKGSKLLSDIFVENRLSAEDKRKVWVLTCNDEIIWAVGLRASRLFNINSSTKQYIQLTLI